MQAVINIVNKFKIVTPLAIAAVGILVFASPASATTIVSSTVIETGDTTPDGSGGDAQLEDNEFSAKSPDGRYMAISSAINDTVTLIDSADNSQVIINDPNSELFTPLGMVFSPDGSTLYVANYDQYFVSVIDMSTKAVVDQIPTTNDFNLAVAVTSDGNFLVIADENGEASIYNLNTDTMDFDQILLAGGYNNYIFISADDSTAYVVDTLDPTSGNINAVTIADGSVNSYQIDNGSGGGVPMDSGQVCISHDLSTIYYTNSANSNTVDAVTLADGMLIDTYANLDPNIHFFIGCAISDAGNHLFATDSDATAAIVYELDLNDGTWLNSYQLDNNYFEGSMSIQVLNNCNAYVAGYYNNVGLLNLDSTLCNSTPPVPTPDNGSLPNTGADISPTIALSGLAVLFGIAIVLFSKRQHS